MNINDHITVCICTFRRPELLKKLLEKLGSQKTEGLFTFSITVVDNDSAQSARDTVVAFFGTGVDIEYHCEPQQNIALARNRALHNADGNYVALIDDDEYPVDSWLLELFKSSKELEADGLQGPVVPVYEEGAPPWVIRGKLYERPIYPRGTILSWKQGMTGNLFLKKRALDNTEMHFDPDYGSGGEDLDFFRRMISRGFVFKFCPDAVVYEFVPRIRWNRSFLLKRALLRGKVATVRPAFRMQSIFKSVAAVAVYSCLLPFSILAGKHVFMKYLIREFDHIGKLLAFCGLDMVKEKYITE